ncbi:hypothetical protein LTR37_007176 [Vermiconidia calcicola]|uniref:Uncharacterized protein n=1 Tax=Vermiconidia calcicola TaxID=1690605 RepID=A0ACC3NES2_9PEZI|nr:hypothetical protein LTR37_007176 [Vermiconidia calcicola]
MSAGAMNYTNPRAYRQAQYTQQQQQQQAPDPNNDLRFKPSKSLREVLLERLDQQQECIETVATKLAALKDLAQAGLMSPGQGMGNLQISATEEAQIKQMADEEGDGDPYEDMPYRRGRRGGPAYQQQQFMPHPQQLMSGSEAEQKFPLKKYHILQEEIDALIGMAIQSGGQQYFASAAQAAQMADPEKAKDDMLAKILGPADGSGPQQLAMAAPPATPGAQMAPQGYQPDPQGYQQQQQWNPQGYPQAMGQGQGA